MPRPRMTLQSGMIAIALAALVLGAAMEWRRHTNDRHGTGYDRARAAFAMRESRRASGGSGTDDRHLVVGVVAAAFVGSHLRRRWLRQA